MAARGRGRNHIASKTSLRYFRTDTDRGRGVLLSSHKTLPGGGRGGRGAQAPGQGRACPAPALPPPPCSAQGPGRAGEGLIQLGPGGARFERQRPDSCVCCGIFKRINAGSNHPAMLDLFLAQAGHCSISAAAGPRGCQFKCKWVVAAAPAKLAPPPGRAQRAGSAGGRGLGSAGLAWGQHG